MQNKPHVLSSIYNTSLYSYDYSLFFALAERSSRYYVWRLHTSEICRFAVCRNQTVHMDGRKHTNCTPTIDKRSLCVYSTLSRKYEPDANDNLCSVENFNGISKSRISWTRQRKKIKYNNIFTIFSVYLTIASIPKESLRIHVQCGRVAGCNGQWLGTKWILSLACCGLFDVCWTFRHGSECLNTRMSLESYCILLCWVLARRLSGLSNGQASHPANRFHSFCF